MNVFYVYFFLSLAMRLMAFQVLAAFSNTVLCWPYSYILLGTVNSQLYVARKECAELFSPDLLQVSLYLVFHSLHHITHASEELTNLFVLEFGVLRLVINLTGAFIFRPLYRDSTGKDVAATDSVDGTAYGHSGRAAVFGNGEGGFAFGGNSI